MGGTLKRRVLPISLAKGYNSKIQFRIARVHGSNSRKFELTSSEARILAYTLLAEAKRIEDTESATIKVPSS